MERQVADVCGCLDGDVYLQDRTDLFPDSSCSSSLSVPWIVVAANPRPTDISAQPTAAVITPSIDDSHNSAARERKHFHQSRDAILHDVHSKLVAIRFLSQLARCPEYSWRGNPCFWKYTLEDICGSPYCDEYFSLSREQRRSWQRQHCAPARDAGEVHEMPKFRLVFSHVKNDILTLCTQAFSATPKDIFRQVDQQVDNMLARVGVVCRPQSRTVDIDFDFSRSQLRVMNSMNGIRDLLEAANGRSESTTTLSRVFFKIQCLNLSETTVCERDLSALAQIMALPALSIRELKLKWVFTTFTSKRFMRGFSQFISTCFAIPLTSTTPVTLLTKLCLDSSVLSSSQLSSLFSAVHEGNSHCGVRELFLNHFEGSDAWMWLTFGVFHPDSKSQIVRLDLSNCVLRLEDIERVQNLLKSSEYGPYLTPKRNARSSSQSDRESGKLWALLPAGTCLEIPRDMKKSVKGRPGPALKLNYELWFEVLELGVTWTCVLVPAYGKLYVKNINFIKTKTSTENQSLERSCKLESLTMVAVKTVSSVLRVNSDGELCGSLSKQPVDHILSEWMKTVGQSVRTLKLRSNPLTNRTLAVILEACPLLQNLDVSDCELTDIAAITNAFRRGDCILRALKASDNHVSVVSQENLFRVLGDQQCDAVRNLQVLHLEGNPTSPENRFLRILHLSLLKNKTLRHLTLDMNEKHIFWQDVKARFEGGHHNEWLGCEGLPCKNCMAVLSVPLVKALPIAVIEIILAFAERDIYRQVKLQ